jgi:hypothetical protein
MNLESMKEGGKKDGKRSALALVRGTIAWAIGIDLVGRYAPNRADGYYVGPTVWWPWVALALAAGVILVGVSLRFIRTTRVRAQISFLLWLALTLTQIVVWGFVSSFPGGWVRLGGGAFDVAGSWLALLLEPILTAACVYCTVRAWRSIRTEANSDPAPRRTAPTGGRASDSKWPYWVFMPLGSVAYTFFCLMFALEAWGRRGEVKPAWFETLSVFAIPGMILPFAGPGILGAVLGAAAVWFPRQLVRLLRRSKEG